MAEFEYRGYRVRTIFEKDWQIKVWPPLRPLRVAERIRASRAEGEHACRHRATAAIDAFIDEPTPRRRRPQPDA